MAPPTLVPVPPPTAGLRSVASLAVAVCALALVTGVDYLTGHDWSVSLFYLGPIVLATWRARAPAGWVFCGLAALCWYGAEALGDHVYSNPSVLVWNTFVRLGFFVTVTLLVTLLREQMARRDALIAELRDALAQIRTLRGLLPICAWCKRVRDDDGYWQQVERYVQDRTHASFSHAMCPDCAKRAEAAETPHT